MMLSEKIAESVTKLHLLDAELQNKNGIPEIFWIGSCFALPSPKMEPFRSQAAGLEYHSNELSHKYGNRLTIDFTLRKQIAAARESM